MAQYTSDRRPSRLVTTIGGGWSSEQRLVIDDGQFSFGSYPNNSTIVVSFDWPLPPEAVINHVELWVKCYSPVAKTLQTQFRLGANTYVSDRVPQAIAARDAASAAWIGFGFPLGQHAWTAAEIADPNLLADIVGGGPQTNYIYIDAVVMRVMSDHGVAVGRPAGTANIVQGATGTAWTNPTLVWSEDPSSGQASLSLGSTGTASRTLAGNTLNANVPADAEVLGIRMRAKAFATIAGRHVVRGALGSTTLDVAIPTADTSPASQPRWLTVGGVKEMWGVAWKPADVNATGFAPTYSIVHTGASGTVTTSLDAIETTVLYKEAVKLVSFEHGMVDPVESVTLVPPDAVRPATIYFPATWVQQWSDTFDDGVITTTPQGANPLGLHWDVEQNAATVISEDAAADQLWFTNNGQAGMSRVYLAASAAEGLDMRDRLTQVSVVSANVAGVYDCILRWASFAAANTWVEILMLSGGWVASSVTVDGVQKFVSEYALIGAGLRFLLREESGWLDFHASTDWGVSWNRYLGGLKTPFSLKSMRVSLFAGRGDVGTGGVAKLDDFVLSDIRGAWGAPFEDESAFAAGFYFGGTPPLGKFSNGGAALPAVAGGKLELALPTWDGTGLRPTTGFTTNDAHWDTRGGELRAMVEMPGTNHRSVLLHYVQHAYAGNYVEGLMGRVGMIAGRHPSQGGYYVCAFIDGQAIGGPAEFAHTPISQSTVWLRLRERDGVWEFAYSLGFAYVTIATWAPTWPLPKVKASGMWQFYADADSVGEAPATVRLADVWWEGAGFMLYPVYEGVVASGLAAAALQTVKPSGIASTAAVGNPKVVAGIHIEPEGIASTAVVPTGALVKLAGTIRPLPGILNASQVGTPRIPAYVRVTGIAPGPPRVGQPTLIREAAVLPPQARVKIGWRIILCDQLGNGLEDISSFALDRQFSYRLNRPEVFTFRVPSDHRLVNELAPDGRPNLAIIRRTVKAFRTERRADGTEFYNLRFVGWVWQLQDEGDADNAWTTVTCFGPMQRLQRRMCVGPSGSITNAAWTATDGGLIIHSMLGQLNAGVAWAHTGVDPGTREPTEARTADLTNMSLAAAIVQLTSAFNGFDVRFVPQDRKDGHLARLDVMAKRGTRRTHAVLGWGIAPHNVTDSSRLFDAEQYANQVTLQGATPEVDGARPIQAEAQNLVQQQDVGIYRSVESYPDVSNPAFLQALATEELGFRARAREIVSLRPQPGRAPEPFTEYDLGDTVRLFVGSRQRGGYQGDVRVYGFDLDVDNEGKEVVSSLVLSPEGA